MKKELKDIKRRAVAQGWTVSQRGSGHLGWCPPKPGPIVVTSSTHSTPQAFRNDLARLKRAGLDLDRNGKEPRAETFPCVCGSPFPSRRSLGQHRRSCLLWKQGLADAAAEAEVVLDAEAEAKVEAATAALLAEAEDAKALGPTTFVPIGPIPSKKQVEEILLDFAGSATKFQGKLDMKQALAFARDLDVTIELIFDVFIN